MAQRPLIRKNLFESRIREAADKALFVVAFLAGIAGILFAKFNNADPFLISGGIIVLMLLYVGICWFTRAARIREDVIGDNVYYLGFLFTLASLAFALYQINTTTQREQVIGTLLSNFGVALASTIAGIFLRVFINQFRVDPVEIEREVRAELIDASTQLRTNLHSTIAQFNNLRTEMTQIVRESIELSVTQHAEAMKTMSDAIAVEVRNLASRLTVDLDKPINEARTGLGGTIDRFQEQTSVVNAGLQEFGRELKSGSQLVMRSFGDAAKRLDTSSQNYAVKLESTGARADSLMAEFAGQLERVIRQASAVLDSFGSISRSMDRYRDEFSKVSREQLMQLSGTTEGSVASSRVLSEIVSKATKDAAALHSAVRGASTLVEHAKTVLSASTTQPIAESGNPRSASPANLHGELPEKIAGAEGTRKHNPDPPEPPAAPLPAINVDTGARIIGGQSAPLSGAPRQDQRSWWPFKRT